MKLYLSSYHLGDNPQDLSNLMGENKKIAIIPNALDAYTDLERRKASLQSEKDDLSNLGLIPEELDLRKYFGKVNELTLELTKVGAVWVLGGNTFVLRRAYKESGFDTWILSQKKDKNFVYAGYSAGICILSPELKSIEMIDEPNIVPEMYNSEIIWEGLGIVDIIFAPHYLSNHPESAAVSKQVEYLKKNNIKYKTLRDGEVFITEV